MSKPAKIAATTKPAGASPTAPLEVLLAEAEFPVVEPESGPAVLVAFPPWLPAPPVAFPVGVPVALAVREATAELGKLSPQIA